ncbi:10175_t:CDS:2, partial [Acaulospora colombiana]
SRWDVAVGETKVVQWETCIYTFTNQAHNILNFCDTAWAQIGDGIAWTCGRWLDDPAKGGICTRTEFYVEAVRTPNMPGPSYTLVHSTDSAVNLNTGSQTSTTSGRTTSSTTTSSSVFTDSTTTATQSLPSLNLSTVSIETLSDIPTISIAQGNSTGNLSPDIGDQTNDQSAKKPETAAIIGGVVGGIAFLALIVAFVLLYRRLKRREKAYQMQHGSSAFLPPPMGRNSRSTDPAWSISSQMYPMEKRRPPPDSDNNSVYQIPDTPSQSVTPAGVTPEGSATNPRSSSDYMTSNIPDTVAQNTPSPSAQPHPRSTHALIAAAAPPNMSQQQIDQLAANFVSLVRGRQADYEEDLDDDDGVQELAEVLLAGAEEIATESLDVGL